MLEKPELVNLVDAAGIDVILAGDSLGMIVPGNPT